MEHQAPLITTIVAALGLAFVLGVLAQRLRISPLVGYLLAGVAMGPFTPGFVADQSLASQLAEIGVILLMFGVGLHFSLKDLLSVRRIAIPGAIAQMAVATLLGMGLAWLFGWSVGGGLVFGLALSVASTVVLIRALQERHLIDSEQGRIALGWLIVEDLAMVVVLVLLPVVAGLLHASIDASAGDGAEALRASRIAATVGLTLLKAGLFVAVMLVIGRRAIPLLFHYVAHTGSRELFRLAVLAVALGVAFGAAELFGVSFALGAFFAGMVLSESELSQRAAEESLPLRDAFAVLFFVSVGMLFDPAVLVRDPWPVVGTVLIIVLGKSIAAFLMVLAFGHPLRTALTISASLAQIGEFSFILASLGMTLGLFPAEGRDLIVAGAILSILFNPILFAALDSLKPWLDVREVRVARTRAASMHETDLPVTPLTGHNVLVGFGRVGSIVGEGLLGQGLPFLIIEDRRELVEQLRARGLQVIHGNAADRSVLKAANPGGADVLFVAIPDAFEAGQIVQQARAANPDLEIIARAHSDAEVEHLSSRGANVTIMGEREIGLGMLEHARGWRVRQEADRAPTSLAGTTA